MATKASVVKGTATAGTTHNVATYQVSDPGSVTRYVQRVSIDDPDGGNVTASSAQVPPAEGTLTSANTPQVVVTSGAKVGWLIYNNSGVTLYMGFHSSVSATGSTGGIPIPNNGSYQQSGPGVFTGDVYLVATTNSKTYRVQTW